MAKISAGIELTVEPAVDDIFPIVDISEVADADKRKKIKWSTIKTVLKAIYDALYAPIAKGVTNGDTHDHSGGDGAQIAYSGLSGLPTYVNLVDRGDPAAADYSTDDFTKDDAWHDLDLSAIVPTNAKGIFVRVSIDTNTVPAAFYLRKNGNSNGYNAFEIRAQVVNLGNATEGIVFIDANRVVEYYATSGVTWSTLSLIIKGWLI